MIATKFKQNTPNKKPLLAFPLIIKGLLQTSPESEITALCLAFATP